MIFLKKLKFNDLGDEHAKHICSQCFSFVDGFVNLHFKHVHVFVVVVTNVVVAVALLFVLTAELGVTDRAVAPAITPLSA